MSADVVLIRAIYENGIFRPLEQVDLPEGARVEVIPVMVRPSTPSESGDDMDEIYEILNRRYNSGFTDTAARHNEHQS